MKYGDGRAILAFLMLGVSSTLAWGQSENSTISGSIKDPADAAIPAAKVKITNVETGTAVDTTTNDGGLYRGGALVPGNYRITVEAAGFSALNRGPITLQVGQTIAIDLTLQV